VQTEELFRFVEEMGLLKVVTVLLVDGVEAVELMDAVKLSLVTLLKPGEKVMLFWAV